MSVTPNYNWPLIEPTDFVTNLPADFEAFGDAVDATVDGIETTANAAQPNVITTEGDLVLGDSSGDPDRLPIGAVGTVLTSDGDTAIWDTPAGGGLVQLATQNMAAIGTVTFSAIPQTYKYLVLEGSNLRNATIGFNIRLQFNGSSASTYDNMSMRTSNATNTGATNATSILIGNMSLSATIGASCFLTFPLYTQANQTKGLFGYFNQGAGDNSIFRVGHHNDTTAALTSITLFVDSPDVFDEGTFTLFGGN